MPDKPLQPAQPKPVTFAQLEQVRSKLFGNSSAPTQAQYDAAARKLGLGQGAYRPVGDNYKPLGASPAQMVDRIHSLQDEFARVASLELRIASLETLLDGLSRRTVHICDSGTDKTMTIVSTAPV